MHERAARRKPGGSFVFEGIVSVATPAKRAAVPNRLSSGTIGAMPTPSESGATLAARGPKRAATQERMSRAAAFEPTPIERFGAALPGPLSRVPVPALCAWVGTALITVLVMFSFAMRSAKAVEILEEEETIAATVVPSGTAAPTAAPTATVKPAPPRAEKGELAAAAAAGTEALQQLAQRFPEDPAVMRELFLVQAGNPKAHSAALRAARRLLDASPDAADDEEVRRALVGIANGPTDTATIALDLMANEMGKRGTELLFDVANGSVMLSKTKASKLLADPEIRKNATPALLIANDLRASLPCARKALFARAKTEADARSLPLLKPLLNTACGGFFRRGAECYRCFSSVERAEIQGIVDAIEAKGGPAPSATTAPSATGAP